MSFALDDTSQIEARPRPEERERRLAVAPEVSQLPRTFDRGVKQVFTDKRFAGCSG